MFIYDFVDLGLDRARRHQQRKRRQQCRNPSKSVVHLLVPS
jgi:hypothetical protein